MIPRWSLACNWHRGNLVHLSSNPSATRAPCKAKRSQEISIPAQASEPTADFLFDAIHPLYPKSYSLTTSRTPPSSPRTLFVPESSSASIVTSSIHVIEEDMKREDETRGRLAGYIYALPSTLLYYTSLLHWHKTG